MFFGAAPQAAAEKTFHTEYDQVVNSFSGGEMYFSCDLGGLRFKLKSGLFKSPQLFWQPSVNWEPVSDIAFKEDSFVIQGLGMAGGVPISSMALDLNIPIFDTGHARDRKVLSNYFFKTRDSEYVALRHTIDVRSGRMVSINIHPVVDYIKFDIDRYRLEQISLPFSMPVTRETQQVVRSRLQLEEMISAYTKELQVTTPPGAYRTTSYCYLD